MEEGSIKSAIEIGEYLIAHAQASYGEMGADHRFDDVKYLWAWISEAGEAILKKQTIWQGTKSRFKKSAALEEALGVLIERGYIREVVSDRPSGRGRPSAPKCEIRSPVCA